MSIVPMPGEEGLAHHECPGPEADRQPIPFAQQIANVAPFIEQAARHVCPDDVDADEIARMAIERFAGIGALEHGDAMFHLTADELLDEEKAEYADAVIYRARRLALCPPRIVAVSQPLTDEEVDRLREQLRATYTGPGAPIVLTPIEPPVVGPRPAPVTFAEFARARSQANANVMKALARFGRAIRVANERREREARESMQRVARAGSAEDPSCFTTRAPCVADTPSGYDESNRAEALHPPQGDA